MNRTGLLLVLLTACGGETFVSEAYYRRDAQPPADATPLLDGAAGDAAELDARADGPSSDASDAGADVAPTCSDAGWTWTCFVQGQPELVHAPGQYCTDWGAVQPAPSACRCAETYSCACLAAHGAGPASCPPNTVWHCDESGGKLATSCTP